MPRRGALIRFLPLAIALALCARTAAGAEPAEEPRPAVPRAVVLVTVDTLRADHVSYLAPDGPPTTPYLDGLAARGVAVERAWAPSSWTSPSMASLFTSLFPKSHGVVTGSFVSERNEIVRQERLSESFVTLAESFSRAGWVTVGAPSNRHLEASLGFAQGFDHYLVRAPFMSAPSVNRNVRKLLRGAFGAAWPAEWKKRKVFLWIHYFDPHAPWKARQPWLDEYAADLDPATLPRGLTPAEVAAKYKIPGPELAPQARPLYRSEVRFWDEQFGQLGRELGLDDPDVLLLVTADHGEELGDHGQIGHGYSLYEEVVRVPMLVRWPDGLPEARRVRRPVSLLDVYPTLLQLAGIERPEGLQGHSVVPALRGTPGSGRKLIRFQLDRNTRMVGVTDGEWKLVRQRASGSRPELYRLAVDPGETRDLAAEQPDRARRLALGLRSWLMSLPEAPEEEPAPPVQDEELRKELEALGYLDGG